MPTYTAPVRDTRFVLENVLDLPALAGTPGFEDFDADMIAPILEEAGKFFAEVVAPTNLPSDRQGCTRNPDGTVTCPDGLKDVYDRVREAGWLTLSLPLKHGGQGMPGVLGMAVEEYFTSANMAFAMTSGLTAGAVEAIMARGSEEMQALYVPKMISGEWSGTMNLTEPHAGTDLGLLRTRAEPNGDGSFAITGSKIFISSGEHDLTENIIHLVLARTPDAPKGTKGISMFVVPKFIPDADGNPGERNSFSCGSIEEKMGIHANPTCSMNYEGATGWLVGDENKGLAAMFIMMNAARLWVGLQGLSQAENAYQNGAAYALDRRQGRSLTGAKDPSESADLLVVHPDVRRMLMDGRAWTEGMRALALWTCMQIDIAEGSDDEAARQKADDMVQLLTPVVKGIGTDIGSNVANDMQQVWGGHGYIEENGMAQFVRDARITRIYEGANGVQAMDLVGRKLPMHGGRAIQALFAEVDADVEKASGDERLAEIATALGKANGELKAASMWLMQNGPANPNNVGSAAYFYMEMLGLVSIGWMWLRSAVAAAKALDEGAEDAAFMEAKLLTAKHFALGLLPDAGALRRKLQAGADTIMAMPADSFLRAG
ncbi:acyl-CoA dehydrogenase C-terminal domain-containing protein [Croceicoccus naphthovorans]|uniref:3-methylmercaptopropionyl-CoA dehydrogenase n=1 Tax=Croceicoccus naphthovorans TaxID=1348774 RepID=A0A0G3XIA6_9SPHN|nr:acyl-CoA dehydrogenase C-terminal domain-containing protein [Croceicoccus naphthovorans]AKM10063.1 acyl-CoA dehydrogenase [Croceicoccus naphthovorans]MBB3991221.1 alkylation response protein AidB-like acyl-CoA dehydrogenase [Croceicoccus naphthovorans]